MTYHVDDAGTLHLSEDDDIERLQIYWQLANIATVAAALQATADKIRRGQRLPDRVMASRLNGLAGMLVKATYTNPLKD